MIVRNAAGKAVFSDRKMGKADLVSGARLFCGLNSFLPGQCHALHSHVGQDKLYLVLEGQGSITVGSDTEHVSAGDVILAEEGVPHAVDNQGSGNLVLLTVMAPPPPASSAG